MKPRTSETDPLRIGTLDTPAGGRIGMTLCPGKHDPAAMTGAWERDLRSDLDVIAAWGARALVTLMETHELVQLGVPDIGAQTESLGMAWYHLPIKDASTPSSAFEETWETAGAALRRILGNGEGIVIHCRGGLGRTGIIAARLLIELGGDPDWALQRVRAARPKAVETREQEAYVLHESLRRR